jgi:hypothetical protein
MRLRVNRTYFRFGRYKNPRRPHPTRVHFGPPASAAKMGSHDGVVSRLHRTRREVGSKCNSELRPPTSHPRVSSSLSPTSLAVCCRPQSSALLSSSSSLNRTLCFHHSPPLVLDPLYYRCCLCFSPCLLFMGQWVENAPPRSTIELPKRMAGCRGPMKRNITDNRRKTSSARDIKGTSRRPWVSG